MCLSCWIEAGSPSELPGNAQEIIEAVDVLYATPECGAGGPLHVQVEDMNVEVDWVPWRGESNYFVEPYPDLVMAKAQVVADLMTPLTVDQRWAVLAKREGWIS